MAGRWRGSDAYWQLSLYNQLTVLEILHSVGVQVSQSVYDKLFTRIIRIDIDEQVRQHWPLRIAHGLAELDRIRETVRTHRDNRQISRYEAGRLFTELDSARAVFLQ